MNLNFKQSEKLVLVLIIFGIISRIIPHPPNFSPVTAIALFSGLNFFNKKIAFTIPLVILIISDFFLGFSLINLFVYISFLTVVFVGTRIKKIRVNNIFLSSLIFFLISNHFVMHEGWKTWPHSDNATHFPDTMSKQTAHELIILSLPLFYTNIMRYIVVVFKVVK